jgi:hypothetical protein
MPKNNNPALKDFAGGILMAFPKGDIENSMSVKVFLVDREFNKPECRKRKKRKK